MIGAYLASLEAALPGRSRSRRALLAEARDGLEDAAAAYAVAGLRAGPGRARAVADFGTVGDIAPLFQQEIAQRQARRTSRILCLALPLLFVAWQALLTAWPYGQRPPHGAVVLAMHLAGLAALCVALGALALLCTGRLGPPARIRLRLPMLMGDAAIVGGLAFSVAVAALVVHLPVTDPAAGALAMASVLTTTATAWSGATCRRAARPATADPLTR